MGFTEAVEEIREGFKQRGWNESRDLFPSNEMGDLKPTNLGPGEDIIERANIADLYQKKQDYISKPEEDIPLRSLTNEIAISTRMLLLSKLGITSCFAEIQGWFQTSTSLVALFPQYEKLDWEKIISTPDELKSLFAQIFAALAAGQQALEFVHKDFHLDNCMFEPVENIEFWTIKLDEETIVYCPAMGRRLRIIDFGRSQVNFPLKNNFSNVPLHYSKNQFPEVTNKFIAGFDLRRFALNFVARIVQYNQISIFSNKVLHDLLEEMLALKYIAQVYATQEGREYQTETFRSFLELYPELLKNTKQGFVLNKQKTAFINLDAIIRDMAEKKLEWLIDKLIEDRTKNSNEEGKILVFEEQEEGKESVTWYWTEYFVLLCWTSLPAHFPSPTPESLLRTHEFFTELRKLLPGSQTTETLVDLTKLPLL